MESHPGVDVDDIDITNYELFVAACILTARWTAYIVLVPMCITWALHASDGAALPGITVAAWKDGVVRVAAAIGCYYLARLMSVPVRWVWRRLFGGWEYQLGVLAFCCSVVPIVIAWATKLAYYGSRWLATGNADWAHEFVPTMSDSMLRASAMLQVDAQFTSMLPYRTTGLALTQQHWRMGMLLTARFFVYAVLLVAPFVLTRWLWRTLHATARARRAYRISYPDARRSGVPVASVSGS